MGDGELVSTEARNRLKKIRQQQVRIEQELESGALDLEGLVAYIEAALKLLHEPQELYRRCGPAERRAMNRALFNKLYIDEQEVTG